MSRSFYYGTDTDLLNGSRNLANVAESDPTVYGISVQMLGEYLTATDNYQTAYEACSVDETRTQLATTTKNQARAILRQLSSDLNKLVDGTPGVSPEQKQALGFKLRKTPVRHGRPTERPLVSLLSVQGRTVLGRVTGEVGSRRKAPNTVAAWIYSYVGEVYPEDPAAWTFELSTTTAKFSVTFPTDVAGGAKVWVFASWINQRQESGPISMPVSTLIQGGLSAAA